MFASPWISALCALFAWWFFTGAILVVVRYADRAGAKHGLVATLLALPLLCLGVWGFAASSGQTTPSAAYIAFFSALAIWGWIELSFLTGQITGPNLYPCPDDLPEWERFIRAWGTIAYHEILLTGTLIALWLSAQDAYNAFGLWTFCVLYFARISAKLNLYFGVPRVNTEFLPEALGHLASHFRISRLNWLFPFSITALSLATACWLERLYTAPSTHEVLGFSLLSAITALALLEHWLMVLPLPDAKLWRWMLPTPKQKKMTIRPERHHGI